MESIRISTRHLTLWAIILIASCIVSVMPTQTTHIRLDDLGSVMSFRDVRVQQSFVTRSSHRDPALPEQKPGWVEPDKQPGQLQEIAEIPPTRADATLVVNKTVVNLYKGPGSNYLIMGQAWRGQRFSIHARNRADTWWQICCLNHDLVWISSQFVDLPDALNSVRVVAFPMGTAVDERAAENWQR